MIGPLDEAVGVTDVDEVGSSRKAAVSRKVPLYTVI